MNVDTVPRTLLIATLTALLCSAMVSAAVYLLRPIYQGYAQVDRNRTILEAAGMLPAGDLSDREIITGFLDLEAHVLDLASGNYIANEDGHNFDHWLPGDETTDSTSDSATRVPVYIVRSEGEIALLVLPVDGPGMWSTIYGYVTLEPDLTTVRDIVFYRHAETPGIGDRIEEPAWRAKWRGKRIYDDDGAVRINVAKRAADNYSVDLISGASVTSDAIGALVEQWFGDDGYRHFLDRLRNGEGT